MTAKPRDRRSYELGQIHKGAKFLGLDTRDKDPDSTYRAMLWVVGRVRSAGDLDVGGREAVLKHMESLGFQPKYWRPKPSQDTKALLSKARAQLHAAGRDETYGDALAKRMFNVERLAWCKPNQLERIVAALWYDQKRRSKS